MRKDRKIVSFQLTDEEFKRLKLVAEIKKGKGEKVHTQSGMLRKALYLVLNDEISGFSERIKGILFTDELLDSDGG